MKTNGHKYRYARKNSVISIKIHVRRNKKRTLQCLRGMNVIYTRKKTTNMTMPSK